MINTSCVNIRGQQQQVTSDEHKEESLAELKAAAAHNDPEALLRLGDAYIYGRYGLTDKAQAYPLMQKAVKSGNPHAMTDMGIIYLKGYGTAVDYRAARTWFEKAAAGGDIKAPRYIGQIYQNGWGTTVDYEKAAQLLQTSLRNAAISPASIIWGNSMSRGWASLRIISRHWLSISSQRPAATMSACRPFWPWPTFTNRDSASNGISPKHLNGIPKLLPLEMTRRKGRLPSINIRKIPT